MEMISVSVTLFLIMDPFGNLPVFMSTLERVSPARRRHIIVRELLFALGIIVLTILCGRYVMSFMGLEQESVSIAGSLILFIIAIRMVFPRPNQQPDGENMEGEPLLVPLAIPLVAGPSLLAVLLLLTTADGVSIASLLASAGIAWSGAFLVLMASTFLFRFLTRRGLVAVERLMGMVLVALAVQLFIEGTRNAFL